jgi:hypothetical protein
LNGVTVNTSSLKHLIPLPGINIPYLIVRNGGAVYVFSCFCKFCRNRIHNEDHNLSAININVSANKDGILTWILIDPEESNIERV